MPKKNAWRMCWSAELALYECWQQRGQGNSIAADDQQALQNWLSGVTSFAFSGQAGICTLRLERSPQGHGYWYAYRRDGKHVHKKYAGKSEDVTIKRLEQVAFLLTTTCAEPSATTQRISTQSFNEPTQQDDPFLEAKLRIPSAPLHVLPRPQLLTRLQNALVRPLTVISAPAGSGKSTLVSSWLAQQKAIRAGWITLEQDDNEPGRLWRLLFTAFERLCPGTGEGPLTLLKTRRQPRSERMLIVLLNQLETRKQEMVLVLDDFHSISDATLLHELTFLLERIPRHVHVMLSTRNDPPMSLARLRVNEQLLELRGTDLNFTLEETRAFLHRKGKRALSSEEIETLFARTEGWIAGLQLVAILLRERETSSDLMEVLKGGHRNITDYLVQEVLNQLPEPFQQFLFSTSILERLQGKLCEAVSGQADGQATLHRLEQANLFLIPLDDRRQWYRYHHLFAQMLRQQLVQKEPELIPILHRRAMHWFAKQGMIAEAIGHAREIGDVAMIATLTETTGIHMVMQNKVASLMPWVNLLPRDMLLTHPVLFVYVCWDMITINRYPTAVNMLQEYAHFHHLPSLATEDVDALEQTLCAHLLAERMAQTSVDERIREDTVERFLHLYGTLAVLRDNRVEFCEELSRRADKYVQRFDKGDRGLSWLLALWEGDVYRAIKQLEETLSAMLANTYNVLGFSLFSTLTHLLTLTGQLYKTERLAQRIMQVKPTPTLRLQQGPACVALGTLAYEWNRLEEADIYLQKGITLCRQFDNAESLLNGLYWLVKLRLLQGDENGASALIRENEAVLRSLGEESVDLNRALMAWRAKVALAWGDTKSARRWIQEVEVEMPLTLPFNPILEECYLLQARILLCAERWSEVEPLLSLLAMAAESQQRRGSLLKIQIYQVLLSQAQGEQEQALSRLACVLKEGEEEGCLRILLDEGATMLTLLTELQRSRATTKGSIHKGFSLPYLNQLLLLLNKEIEERKRRGKKEQLLIEPLSKRERDVLQLMSEGKSNYEIAQHLVIAVSTVKTHLNTIYGKLQVQSRTQALVRARTLHLCQGDLNLPTSFPDKDASFPSLG